MANRYYTSFPLCPGEVILQGPEARHLATVMRTRPGDAVCLFNGDGCEYPATVVTVSKRDVTLRIESVEKPQRELSFQIEIAAAVPKGDREEFLIEKLTELGVTRFVPLVTERSVVVPKIERLRRTVIEASKQCGRNALMAVAEVQRFDDYLRQSANVANRWLAHPHSPPSPGTAGQGTELRETTGTREDPHPPPLSRKAGKEEQGNQTIAIGPEGGFTESEVNAANTAGWQCVDLGPCILRIETAAIALAAYCSFNANNA
jgi:16S rRNA (uracil1498-N3)-methyltransferase